MRLTSSAFTDGSVIPTRFAMTGVVGGRNVSVPLAWDEAPEGTRSFVLSMIDHHPIAHGWVHWLVIDIPADARGLDEGASSAAMPLGSIELNSSYGRPGYGGPLPPAGTGPHDYVFTLYALDVPQLDAGDNAVWDHVKTVLEPHVLGSATLLGVLGA
jgi:Raf kinase inhibitor-like YbhB/YbcL family protein